jgi:hypothetical protein
LREPTRKLTKITKREEEKNREKKKKMRDAILKLVGYLSGRITYPVLTWAAMSSSVERRASGRVTEPSDLLNNTRPDEGDYRPNASHKQKQGKNLQENYFSYH